MLPVPADPAADPATSPLAARFAAIRAEIVRACVAAGRAADAAQLIAVSKTQPVAAIEQALAAGQRRFGENSVQEAQDKFPPLRARYPDLRLHLIGPLQTNKARNAVRLADVVETLDRPRLAEAIADAVQREGRQPLLLVQVNTGDEPQKAGVARAQADAAVELFQARFGAALVGLMAIPPQAADPVPHFAWLAACAARHGLPVLSMGMSADYIAAIGCGATQVRVGSALFGARG